MLFVRLTGTGPASLLLLLWSIGWATSLLLLLCNIGWAGPGFCWVAAEGCTFRDCW
jgi:hypothetical protein